ncbi:MAG: acyl-CoA dehydrogenase family protein [Streptosporangiales bacterium]|nr:acyl-CoA dehydrogenase family protein [Streptosporangiales bacterium]
MKLGNDPEVEKFRADLAAFLDESLPDPARTTERSHSSADVPAWAREWQRTMFDNGWLLPMQPPEFGGRDATLPQMLAYQEELSARRIYQSFNPQGVSIIAASLLTFGTEEQKRRWAVPILRAEITAALGMSEPGAGSDLAGLRTRAVADGDDFVINGQKVWTSGAHDADVILAFVRTDPDAPKHKGISVLLVPTDTEGVTRRPFPYLISQDGEIDFNEVFFDDARVPRENLVGELNQGWKVANGSLGHERTMLWVGYAERLDDLVHDSPSDSEWYATLQMDLQALRLLGYQNLAGTISGTANPSAVSVLKLFGSEAVQAASLRALAEHGSESLLFPHRTGPDTPFSLDDFGASWFERYARSFPGTIAGGTSEIQRNIIAERILGLPR